MAEDRARDPRRSVGSFQKMRGALGKAGNNVLGFVDEKLGGRQRVYDQHLDTKMPEGLEYAPVKGITAGPGFTEQDALHTNNNSFNNFIPEPPR